MIHIVSGAYEDDTGRGGREAIHNIVITASSSSYSVLKRFTAVIIYPVKGYAGDKLYTATYARSYVCLPNL